MATQLLEPGLPRTDAAARIAPTADPAPNGATTSVAAKRYLFGPLNDFLCLGGSSLLILPLLMLLPKREYQAPLAIVMLTIAHVVNHPHFAHSYQIF